MTLRHRWASWFSVVIVCLSATAMAQPRWKVMPIRSQEQFDLGMIGGEGEQHPHGMARSVSRPDVIYLSHDVGQIWRSVDSGRSWKRAACRGMYAVNGQSIEVDPVRANVVYAIIDAPWSTIHATQEGLYRSTDWGESWDLVLQTYGAHQRIHQHNIAYDPASITAAGAQRWVAAFPDNGVYESTDGGLTWSSIAFLTGHIETFAIQTHVADGATAYVGTDQGLFMIMPGVPSPIPWGNLPAGAVTWIEMHPTDAQTFYAVVRGVGLYCTTDGGTNFALVRAGDTLRVHLNPTDPDVMYLLGDSDNMVVSHNAGASWSPINAIMPLGLGRTWKNKIKGAQSAVSPDPRDTNAAVAYGISMLWATTDGGTVWGDSSAGFTGYNWAVWNDGVAYDVSDPNRFAIFIADAGLLVTDNGGDWFERRSIPTAWRNDGTLPWSGMHAGAIYPQTGSDTIVSSCGYYVNCGIVRTTNAGDSFTLLDNNLHNYRFIAYNTDDPTIVYAGDKRSTDSGQTFQPIAALVAETASIIGMCKAQPDTVYAIDDTRKRILRSDDAGATWYLYVQLGWALSDTKWSLAFVADPINPDRIYFNNSAGDLLAYEGGSYDDLRLGSHKPPAPYDVEIEHVTVDPQHPEVLYVSLNGHGISQLHRSTDAGQTWEDISANLPLIGGITLSVHPLTGDLFVGTPCGTYVYPPPYASANLIYDRLPDYLTPGDFDYNGVVDADDVDLLAAAIAAGSVEMRFNLHDEDDVIDAADMDVLLTELLGGLPGDADLDGDVDLDDFVALKLSFGMTSGAAWSDGDFDGDGDVDLDDFVILKTNFGR